MKELRQAYSAPTEEEAIIALDKLDKNVGKNIHYQLETKGKTGLTLLHFSSILM